MAVEALDSLELEFDRWAGDSSCRVQFERTGGEEDRSVHLVQFAVVGAPAAGACMWRTTRLLPAAKPA